METKNILRMLNRRAIFSVVYLLMAVAFIVVGAFFYPIYEYEYTHHALSPLANLHDMLDPFEALLLIATVFVYCVHFVYGAFYYPRKYRDDIKMDIGSSDPETEKESNDASMFRGSVICVILAAIFSFAFHDSFPLLILVLIIIGWFSLHFMLIILTSTANFMVLAKLKLDVSVILPEEYPIDEDGEHTYMELNFFIPTCVDETAWSESYVREYVKYKRAAWSKQLAYEKRVKDFSEKMARS